MEALEQFDRWLFLWLNSIHSSWMDPVMSAISGKYIWIPFYAFLLYLLVRQYGVKTIYLALMTGIVVTLCDQLSVHLFKNVFMRYRPCHNLEIQSLVHIVNDRCGGQFGFISSHASNSFGLAVYLGLLLRKGINKMLLWLLIWAAIVSYSRIYLGVHYPSDIVGGAIFGSFIGILCYRLINLLDKQLGLGIFET